MTVTTTDPAAVTDDLDEVKLAQRSLETLEHELRADIPRREQELRLLAQRDNDQAVLDGHRAPANLDELNERKVEKARLARRNNDLLINLIPKARSDLADARRRKAAAAERALMPDLHGPGLAKAVVVATDEIETLEAEQRSLPAQIQKATMSASIDDIVRARARLADIPDHIFAARAQLMRLKMMVAGEDEAKANAAQPAVQKRIDAKRQAVEEAEAEHAAVVNESRSLRWTASNAREKQRRLRYELSEMLSERSQRDAAPIVRSLRHAPRQ
jgi:hypothetical protein